MDGSGEDGLSLTAEGPAARLAKCWGRWGLLHTAMYDLDVMVARSGRQWRTTIGQRPEQCLVHMCGELVIHRRHRTSKGGYCSSCPEEIGTTFMVDRAMDDYGPGNRGRRPELDLELPLVTGWSGSCRAAAMPRSSQCPFLPIATAGGVGGEECADRVEGVSRVYSRSRLLSHRAAKIVGMGQACQSV